ncbi:MULTISPECIES: hypothetical protein [Bacillus cereus group]|uniref:hypothetical protein n=1 Tax=Bacillus cereus group TaxID=86661 RepID=UPI000BFC1E40|nr:MULTISPECIES: hypothetical protein [Bacillus cereus group]MBJ7945114.1 hypothetical protein [Bacillus cereus group sp. N24]PGQ56076.1 hypothetical protein COA16_24730 [Bacillus thuringiensis]
MNKKIIEDLIEEVIEEAKEEIKEEIKEKVKEKVLGEISKEISEETTEEEIRVSKFKRITLAVMAIVFYIFISVFYLLVMKDVYYIIKNTEIISDITKNIVYLIIVFILAYGYLKVAHTLYRFKQNKNTLFLYALFEIGLGIVTVVVTGWAFLDEPSNGGIKPVTFLGFYGGMYVIIRGMETARKNFSEGEKPEVFFMDLSKETILSNFFNKYIRSK